jgi:hypothetical protein
VAGRFARDPISEHFDGAAADLLRRAYAQRGQWAAAWVPNPSAEWREWALANGWGRLLGPDDAPGGQARTRWCRAFIRSVWDRNRKYMTSHGLDLDQEPRPWGIRPPWSLDYRVGTRLAEVYGPGGGGLIARKAEIRLLTQAEARKFAAEIPAGKRWITEDGHPGPRYANWSYHE